MANKNPGIKFIIDTAAVEKLLQEVPKSVATRGINSAMTQAVKPVLSKAKAAVASGLILSNVNKKGIKDYKRSMAVKKVNRKGFAMAFIGADFNKPQTSGTQRKGQRMTNWARLAHLFEFGASLRNGGRIIGNYAMTGLRDNEEPAIIRRFERDVVAGIQRAARRHAKLKAKKVI